MALFFPQELSTSVEFLDGLVYIRQYSDDSCDNEIGVVVLTKHQFDEIYNHEKQIFEGK